MKSIILGLIVCTLAGCASTTTSKSASAPSATPPPVPTPPPAATGAPGMRLGNFSVSLAVKDLAASRAFYEKLGFKSFGGDQKTWLILQNGACTIGLFQGMFDKNMLTFNPGWDNTAKTLPDFDDVRTIQRTLKDRGITLTMEADQASTGPASVMLVDPDGNPILIDQHVPKPAK